MGRRYVRDAQGRFAEVPGVKKVEISSPVMAKGLSYSVGSTKRSRYKVEGKPTEFRTQREANSAAERIAAAILTQEDPRSQAELRGYQGNKTRREANDIPIDWEPTPGQLKYDPDAAKVGKPSLPKGPGSPTRDQNTTGRSAQESSTDARLRAAGFDPNNPPPKGPEYARFMKVRDQRTTPEQEAEDKKFFEDLAKAQAGVSRKERRSLEAEGRAENQRDDAAIKPTAQEATDARLRAAGFDPNNPPPNGPEYARYMKVRDQRTPEQEAEDRKFFEDLKKAQASVSKRERQNLEAEGKAEIQRDDAAAAKIAARAAAKRERARRRRAAAKAQNAS